MKKLFLSIAFLLVVGLSSSTAQAQVFVPKQLNFKAISATSPILTSTTTPIFKVGDVVNLESILNISDLPQDKTMVEYGIFRQIINGNTTQYEPINISATEKAYSTQGSKSTKITIPNVLSSDEASTYVFYAKISVTDDADKENVIFSKNNFKIKGNDSLPLTKIKYINLLQSDGKRFSLSSGPTIYDLSKTTYKGIASSTSIEITFESNTDTTISPNITFKRLRSDVQVPDFKPEDIKIKKGLNTILIPLPVFNYEPGVYQGVLKLKNVVIPDVEFQYIVGGDMVTFGLPTYSTNKDNQIFDFNIYGTPIDLNLDVKLNNFSTSTIEKIISNSNLTYNTEFILKDKNDKELYKISKGIDFSTSTYSLIISKDVKNIAKVSIKTVDNEGKVLYDGTKDLNLPIKKTNTLMLVSLAILLLLVLSLAFVFKHKYAKLVIVIIAILILLFGIKIVKADVWNVTDNFISSASFNGDAAYYRYLTNLHRGSSIRFNTNIQAEQYNTNEDLYLTYSASFEVCNNSPTNLQTAVYLMSADWKVRSTGGYNVVYSGDAQWTWSSRSEAISFQKHNYTYTSNWITVNLGKPKVNDFVRVEHNVRSNGVPVASNIASLLTSGLFGHISSSGSKDASVVYQIAINIIDKNIPFVSASVDGITPTSARINWIYKDEKPQANYQVQLSSNSDFSEILQDKTGVPIVRKNSEGFFANLFDRLNIIKKANADLDVSSVRSASVDNLVPDTMYYVRIKVNNGKNWSPWVDVSFSTAEDAVDPLKDPATGLDVDLSGAGCNINGVKNGEGLDASTPNLCVSGQELITGTFKILNSSLISSDIWSWKCKSSDNKESKCKTKCNTGLVYDSATKKCVEIGSNGDFCPFINGKQGLTDPIFMVSNCQKPNLNVSVNFHDTSKPYADETTSKCSFDWKAIPSFVSMENYTKCNLDGDLVDNEVSGRAITVGSHTLSCVTKITGDVDLANPLDTPPILSSDPVAKTFKCSRVPKANED